MISKLTLSETATLHPDRQLTGARFAPGGDLLASGGFDASVRLWRSIAGQWAEQPRLAGHHGWVEGLTFAPDGHALYTADSWGQLTAWSLVGDDPVQLWSRPDAHDGWIRQVAVSPDGATLATCGRDRALRLWRSADGAPAGEFPRAPADLFAVVFHPAGGALVTGDLYGRVQQWDPASRSAVRSFEAAELFIEDRLQEVGGARRLVFDAAGTTLAVAGTRPKNGGNVQGIPVVLLFDWESGTKTHTLELGTTSDVYVCDVAFHPEGCLIAVTSGNPGTGQIVCLVPGAAEPLVREKKLANCHAVSLAPDGAQLVVTSTNKGSNGNGRKLEADGSYAGNTSPLTLFRLELETAVPGA